MKLKTKLRLRAGFTLAEVLAALAFMAIVIPVAIRGLQIANRAGVVAQRKAMAARVGERLLNEIVVTQQWNLASQAGNTQVGPYQFRWSMKNEPWTQAGMTGGTTTSTTGINQNVVNANTLHELSVDVTFNVQGQDYSVHLSTLADVTKQATGTGTPML